MGFKRRAAAGAEAQTARITRAPGDRVIALAGNPNVGKSTLFNSLTGLRQHTGNWPGKTVSGAVGRFARGDRRFWLVDLPGTYSLRPHSAEEEVTRDFLTGGEADAVIVVCDATCLERNLILALQTFAVTDRAVVCVNLLDEAKRKGITVDLAALERELGVPVVGTVARKKRTLRAVRAAVETVADGGFTSPAAFERGTPEEEAARAAELAERIAARTVHTRREPDAFDRRMDRVLTGRWGRAVMIALLALILWLTVSGANLPSALLARALFWVQDRLAALFAYFHAPAWLTGALVYGVYRVLAWVVSVMLPPMAIFFPLFTLLEDAGYLPRVAYNLDRPFRRCKACGKQALTMCMGFGCNAAGVAGCRIIDSPRERLIAVLTNSFVPCNGRFPILITVITLFFVGLGGGPFRSIGAALLLTLLILLGIGATFLASRLLSATVLRGAPSSFVLELPPYRKPQIGRILVRSVLDRTLFVLGRAAAVAAPAGLLIWLMANVSAGGASLLQHAAAFLDPLGRALGMDGVILIAFILGLPANETVLPIVIMAYTAGGTLQDLSPAALHSLLLANGWSVKTALCTAVFTLMHWPCSTTLWTVKKETGSWGWTALAALLPTAAGMILCFLIALVFRTAL